MEENFGLDICKNGLPVATFVFNSEEKRDACCDHFMLIDHLNQMQNQKPHRVTFADVVENRVHNKDMSVTEGQELLKYFYGK